MNKKSYKTYWIPTPISKPNIDKTKKVMIPLADLEKLDFAAL